MRCNIRIILLAHLLVLFSIDAAANTIACDENDKLRKNLTDIFGPDNDCNPQKKKDKVTSRNLGAENENTEKIKCTTDDGVEGVCELHFKCDPVTQELFSSSTVVGPRISECPTYHHRCCKLRNQSSTDISVKAVTRPKSGDANGKTGESCTRADGTEGICAFFYNCDQETQAFVSNPDSVGPRELACSNARQICCKLEADVKTSITLPPPVSSSSPQATPDLCGYSNPGALAFRGFQDKFSTVYGQYPWIVALLRTSKAKVTPWTTDNFLGGGVLIHPKVVITVANNVDILEPNDVTCRVGEWNVIDEEKYTPQNRVVEAIHLHEKYFKPYLENNLALLILKNAVVISKETPHIAVACLGHALPNAGTICESAGWGKLNFTDKEYPVVLKKVSMPLVEHDSCESVLRANGFDRSLHKGSMCAGGIKGDDVCVGDGGSPLMCHIGEQKDMRYAVFGLVSWGIQGKCGVEGIPGVYVNLEQYTDWIKEKMASSNLITSSFEY